MKGWVGSRYGMDVSGVDKSLELPGISILNLPGSRMFSILTELHRNCVKIKIEGKYWKKGCQHI
jgi:hypothetical protein